MISQVDNNSFTLQPSPNGIQSVYTAIQQEYNISDLFSMKLCPARDVFGDTVVPSGGELVGVA